MTIALIPAAPNTPDPTIFFNAAGAFTTPPGVIPVSAPPDATKFLNGTGVFSVPPSGGGGVNGNLQPGVLGGQGNTGVRNKSLWFMLPNSAWIGLPAANAWKLRFRFTGLANGCQIGNMVIVKAFRFRGGAARPITVTTQIKIGGTSAPLIAATGASEFYVDTDPINVAVVSDSDYFLIVFFSDVGANDTVSVSHNVSNDPYHFGTDPAGSSGDETGATATPSTTDPNPLTAAQANLVSNVLAV